MRLSPTSQSVVQWLTVVFCKANVIIINSRKHRVYFYSRLFSSLSDYVSLLCDDLLFDTHFNTSSPVQYNNIIERPSLSSSLSLFLSLLFKIIIKSEIVTISSSFLPNFSRPRRTSMVVGFHLWSDFQKSRWVSTFRLLGCACDRMWLIFSVPSRLLPVQIIISCQLNKRSRSRNTSCLPPCDNSPRKTRLNWVIIKVIEFGDRSVSTVNTNYPRSLKN